MSDLETIELIDLPRGRISPSGRTSFLVCAHKFERMYVNQEKQASNSRMILGTAFHMAEEYADRCHRETGKRPLLGEMQEVAGQSLGRAWSDEAEKTNLPIELLDGDSPESLAAACRDMVCEYETVVGMGLDKPSLIEHTYVLTYENAKWESKGRLDLYTTTGKIIDRKTGKKAQPGHTPYTSDQLTEYWIAMDDAGLSPSEIEIHTIARLKKGAKVTVLPTPDQKMRLGPAVRTPLQCEAYLENTARIVAAIRSGAFPKAVDPVRSCSWCGFVKTCRPDWSTAMADGKEE